MTALIVITWLFVLLILFALLFYLWYDRYQRKLHEHRRVEISELAMVFQTLRDIVSEQKALAKEFNEQVEEKLLLVRGIVSEAQNHMNKINQELHEQSKKLKDLQEQIDGIVCQSHILTEKPSNNVKKNKTASISKLKSVHEELPFTPETERLEPALDNLSTLEKDKNDEINIELIESELRNEKNAISPTISLMDAKEEDNKLDKKDLESLEREQDEIKNEYRSLLGNSEKELATGNKQMSSNIVSDQTSELTPIQKVVLEYHNAGMTTSEIAKELGIGKGEVWLILKLAISKSEKE